MGKTYTDFSQLSKGMFRKNDPVVEVKPQPEAGNGQRGTGNEPWGSVPINPFLNTLEKL